MSVINMTLNQLIKKIQNLQNDAIVSVIVKNIGAFPLSGTVKTDENTVRLGANDKNVDTTCNLKHLLEMLKFYLDDNEHQRNAQVFVNVANVGTYPLDEKVWTQPHRELYPAYVALSSK